MPVAVYVLTAEMSQNMMEVFLHAVKIEVLIVLNQYERAKN